MSANAVLSAETFLDRFGDETINYKAEYYPTTEAWEKGRKAEWWCDDRKWRTFGASDLPVIAGVSNWMTRDEFFDIATGRAVREFKGNADTDRGHAAEPRIRELWAIEHPDYDVYDGTGIIFRSKRSPWQHASLDGIVVERATGRIGVLEIKDYRYSAEWRSGNPCPVGIFLQVIGQGWVTGFSFGIVRARLLLMSGEATERQFLWNFCDQEVEEQTASLVEDVAKFHDAVVRDERPAPRLAL